MTYTCVNVCADMQILMRVVVNPYIYMDKVGIMVQEAACLQAKHRGQDANTSCAPISHIDGKLSYSFADVLHYLSALNLFLL